MARRWRNYTDLPDETLKAIYAAVLPSGLKAHDVEVKNHGGFGGRGMAYSNGSGYHATARPFVVVSIPKSDSLSRHRRHQDAKGGYLPIVIGSRLEAFVFIMAHELTAASLASEGKRQTARHGLRRKGAIFRTRCVRLRNANAQTLPTRRAAVIVRCAWHANRWTRFYCLVLAWIRFPVSHGICEDCAKKLEDFV